LAAEIFKHAAGVDIVHVPYRGDAPLVTALIANDIQLAFLPQSTGGAAVQSHLIRGLAVTGTGRMSSFPDLPTVREQGYEGLEAGSWNAMFVAAGTPPDIVQTIQQNVAKAIADPQVRDRLLAAAQEPVGNTPAAFQAMFKADIARFATVIEQAKIPKQD
jgi:tripartite-type tricarboxylate transporter receptor subunit TctC